MKKYLILIIAAIALLASGCLRKQSAGEMSVLVFVPGHIAGSSTYELMVQGSLEFAEKNPGVSIKVYEAGFNQAEWEQQIAEMVSSGQYDIFISSNPSLPELCANVAEMFYLQKFIILDADYEGHSQIKTYSYNQYEQSLFLGYLAGLITTSNMKHANAAKRIGFIAAQEYPLLTRQMIPGFLDGARLVDPQIELDRRIIGSWADANKAAELASAMIDTGVDVFTSIAGGASTGIIKTARDRGAYVLSYNSNEYNNAPGTIVGCGVMEIKKLVMEVLEQALNNEIEYGKPETVGLKEGYLNFIFNDPGYYDNIPQEIRQRFEMFVEELRGM
ncbi:MAG: BMP family ABC transporter substrate-binding protein [Treponema sp.]|jgi:simple sugar transport system substrate-binding protein|nr:BMP family ABC transporter substrate-binding protein [Treponema sp.]